MIITKKTTHVQDAKDRLPWHLKDSTEFNKLIGIFAARFQGLEDELDDMLNNITGLVSTAEGAQLDVIGIILDLTRIVGEADAEYRIRLQGQTPRLAKSGQPEVVIDAYILVTVTNNVLLKEFSPAAVELTAFLNTDDFTLTQDQAIIDTMQQVIAAGVSAALQVQESNRTFLWGDTADADANGDIAINVNQGLGDTADADADGNIASGIGKGGDWARVLNGIAASIVIPDISQWYITWAIPAKRKIISPIVDGFISDSPFPFL